MIEIEAIVENDGTLRSCKAEGHAGAGKTGNDIVCAAVSVLMRTAYSVLSGKDGITVSGAAPKKGAMRLEVDYTAGAKEFLFSAGVFLLEGLRSVAQEYPGNCRVNIKKMI